MKFNGIESEPGKSYYWSGDGWEVECVKPLSYTWWEASALVQFGSNEVKFRGGPQDTAELAIMSLESGIKEIIRCFGSLVYGQPLDPPVAKKRWWQ